MYNICLILYFSYRKSTCKISWEWDYP